jgi:hypothetical protein
LVLFDQLCRFWASSQHSPPNDQKTKLPQVPAPNQQPTETIDKFPLCSPTELPPNLPFLRHKFDGDLLHIFKHLPGITLSVLQDHLLGFLQELHDDSFLGPSFQIAQYPVQDSR